MPKTIHHAFRTEYNKRTKVLTSQVRLFSSADNTKQDDFSAIWDTGAQLTVITPNVAEKLKLPVIDSIPVIGVNSKNIVPVVLVNIGLPNRILIPNVRVAISNIGGTDMLIGMDIITLGDFLITNKDNKTELSFVIPPFENRSDLLEKAEKVNKRNKHNISKTFHN